MYQIGDLIIYSSEGACRIDSIEKLHMSGVSNDNLYYGLCPVYHRGKIFVPIDTKLFMRPIISCEEAKRLIRRIPSIQEKIVHNQSKRLLEDHYNGYMRSHDCMDLLKLIKTIYLKGTMAAVERKKLGSIDERFKKKAEDLLYCEFAIALSIPKEKVKSYIENEIKEIEISDVAIG